jgi:uncharacterized protein YbjT (DUF2867 family)
MSARFSTVRDVTLVKLPRRVGAGFPSPGEGSAYDVTGPETLAMAETAERLSAPAGCELRYEDKPVEAGREWRGKLGAPDWEVETWLRSKEFS